MTDKTTLVEYIKIENENPQKEDILTDNEANWIGWIYFFIWCLHIFSFVYYIVISRKIEVYNLGDGHLSSCFEHVIIIMCITIGAGTFSFFWPIADFIFLLMLVSIKKC